MGKKKEKEVVEKTLQPNKLIVDESTSDDNSVIA